MNHSESNLNKLFNQCYILLPDLDNSLSKGLFWPVILLSRGPRLWSWLSLLMWPQSLHSGAPLCRRVLSKEDPCGAAPITSVAPHPSSQRPCGISCATVSDMEGHLLTFHGTLEKHVKKHCKQDITPEPRIMAPNRGKKVLVGVGEKIQLGRLMLSHSANRGGSQPKVTHCLSCLFFTLFFFVHTPATLWMDCVM